jgi:hypothetical protein
MSAPDTSIPCQPSANSLLTNKIIFGQTTQLTHANPYSPSHSTEGVKKNQGIIGALLYYACAVDNKLLATLSILSSQQATATEATNVAMNQLLNYLATYPDNGTTYRTRDMILCTHANASFHNKSKGCTQAGAHIFVSKNNPFSEHNGPVLSISQIMKFVMSSAAKAKLGALYTTAKEMAPLCQTLIEMGWPQPCMPIQMDNSTAVGITNLTIFPQKPIPWISAYGDSAAKNLNNSSATTGIRAITIGQTTTPSTTHQSTTKPTDPSMLVQQPNYLEMLPLSGPAASFFYQTHQHAGFFSLQTKMSLQGCIVHLLLTYGANTHKARSSDLVYLVTWNLFTLLLGRKWTYGSYGTQLEPSSNDASI